MPPSRRRVERRGCGITLPAEDVSSLRLERPHSSILLDRAVRLARTLPCPTSHARTESELSDTSPEAERLQLEVLDQIDTAEAFARAEIRLRHPRASDAADRASTRGALLGGKQQAVLPELSLR